MLRRKSSRDFNLDMTADSSAKFRPVYEHLDTAFVNLGALLYYLQQRAFTGRVHVVLDEYEADVLLDESGTALVIEKNHATGSTTESTDALPHLLVRAREPGGLITVYEDAYAEATAAASDRVSSEVETEAIEAAPQLSEEVEWRDLLRLSGEIIAAVERAALSAGMDFTKIFGAAQLELADDFSFLDPSSRQFEYAYATVRLHANPGMKVFITGLSESLRRVVEKLATGVHGRRLRERVALELAVLARRRQTQLARFKLAPQLDRIAGTRVL